MSKIDDGGPAFPTPVCTDTSVDSLLYSEWEGMTLRDYFAAKAMQGMLAADAPEYTYHNNRPSLVENAYMVADAMLAARKLKL